MNQGAEPPRGGEGVPMISASEIQAVLMGAGGFLGASMAGVGAYRLFSGASRELIRIPGSLEKSAESLERVAGAIETQNMVSDQVMELKGLMLAMREEVAKIAAEREQIGRELRLMSRKIEHVLSYAQEGD